MFVLVGEGGQTVDLIQHHLLQKIQTDVMCCRAFPQTRIVVLTAEILDVVVFLVEVEVEITAALGAFQPPGEHARLLGNSRLLTACTFLHGLHLFPCGPVNDRLVDIEKDSSVFLGIFNATFHFIGL